VFDGGKRISRQECLDVRAKLLHRAIVRVAGDPGLLGLVPVMGSSRRHLPELTFQTVRILEPDFCRCLRRHSQKSIARTDEPAQSSFARPRSFLEEDRRNFAVSRRILEPSVGRLGRRVFGATCARAISSFSRARASARLASCVRCTRDVMINTPSCVARLPASARRRRPTSAGSERDWPTSKRSWTAVETLLTFWPPGPEARTKVIVSSESGMNMRKCYFQISP